MASARSLRVTVAAAPAAGTIALAWALLERPVSWPAFVLAALLALAPTAIPRGAGRAAAAAAAIAVVPAVVFHTWPHRALADAWAALHDAPAVRAPFDPAAFPLLHGLVACAALGLALAAMLAVPARRGLLVAAVAVGVGFPATLLEDAHAVALGVLALGSVLWAPAVLGARRVTRLVPALSLAAAVVVAAAAAASSGVAPGDAHVDWRGWDPFARGGGTGAFRFVWDASYSGISFPPRPTVVFRVRAPKRAQYWRASTLDTFVADRWIEDLYPVDAGVAAGSLPADPLVPARDRKPRAWLRQQVTVDRYGDDHVVAAGEPARVDGRALGRVSFLSGGVMRAATDVTPGTTYSVWSYAPRPAPRALAASPARYPPATARYLELLGRAQFPGFGVSGRVRHVDALFADDRYQPLWAYRPLWRDAQRITSHARSPYEATLLLERWFRSGGNFTYDEQPPATRGQPPLVAFVETTRAGYCQHFAGAMAVMLRMLGVPARVAVGFTAGTWKGGVWTVTDYQAHAWVEAWFAGFGWLTFDPTPGRGTLSAAYTFASDSADAVAALGTGRFLDFDRAFRAAPGTRGAPAAATPAPEGGVAWWVALLPALPAAAAALVLLAKSARRARRLRRRDSRRLAWGVRAELVGELVDRGVAVEPHATTAALQRTAEHALGLPCGALAAALAEARYGPADRSEGAARRAREELRRILALARSRERPGTRVRCALSLRSLRPGLTPSAR